MLPSFPCRACLEPALFLVSGSPARAETPEELLAHVPTVPTPLLRERLVSKYVVILLSKYHYHPQNITPAISAEWFKEYFNSLDFNRTLFLESDLEDFRSFESVLWDQRTMTANLEFPFKVYQRYLERVRQRALFSIAAIDDSHDFSVRESMNTDFKGLPAQNRRGTGKSVAPASEKRPPCQPLARGKRRCKKQKAAEAIDDNAAAKERRRRSSCCAGDRGGYSSGSGAALETTPFPERLAKITPAATCAGLKSKPSTSTEIYLTALTRVLDPHSAYMAPETKEVRHQHAPVVGGHWRDSVHQGCPHRHCRHCSGGLLIAMAG